MSDNIVTDAVAPMSTDVDDAVGVLESHWFVAIVNHNSELTSAEKLTAMGYDCYVASQEEYRVWRNGKRKKINRVVIPSMVFVRCTERERLNVVKLPFIFRFLTNKAGMATNNYNKPVAIIPNSQMNTLMFMLGNSDQPVEFTAHTFAKGDRVRVVRGRLMGLEGEVFSAPDGRSHLVISLNMLGCARTSISPADLSPLS